MRTARLLEQLNTMNQLLTHKQTKQLKAYFALLLANVTHERLLLGQRRKSLQHLKIELVRGQHLGAKHGHAPRQADDATKVALERLCLGPAYVAQNKDN
jgi:hypothetical protein